MLQHNIISNESLIIIFDFWIMIDDFLIFSNFVVVTADFLLARFIPLWEPLQARNKSRKIISIHKIM